MEPAPVWILARNAAYERGDVGGTVPGQRVRLGRPLYQDPLFLGRLRKHGLEATVSHSATRHTGPGQT